jgi:hypothetical protein
MLVGEVTLRGSGFYYLGLGVIAYFERGGKTYAKVETLISFS